MKKTTASAAIALSIFVFSFGTAFAADLPCTRLSETLSTGSFDGNTSGAVTKLQKFLKAKGLLTGEISGVYDESTVAGVMAFQAEHAILRTGATGPTTRLRIEDVSCAVEPLPPKPDNSGYRTGFTLLRAPDLYNPALPPPLPEPEALDPVKILYKKGAYTDDKFRKYDFDFINRDNKLDVEWWVIRVYCERAVARFGDDFEFGCGEETDRIYASKTKKGSLYKFHIESAVDGPKRGRVTVRAWAFNEAGKIIGDNYVYYWAR